MIQTTHAPDITEEWLINCSEEELRKKLELLRVKHTFDAGE